MDQKDFYNQIKNAFILGNYHKVFDFLKTYAFEEQNFLYQEEICSLIVRSFIALEDRKTPEIQKTINSNPDLEKMLSFFSLYVQPLLEVNTTL